MAGLTGLFVARDGSNNGTTPKGARQALGGLLAGNGATPLDVRRGVLVDNGGPVVAGTSGMTYDVRAFRAVTMASSANGPTVVANDATVNVATDPAPGANSRIDVIWAQQHLVSGDGGSETDVILEIGVTQGAVAASPTVPAIPTGALSLAQVTVTSGTTATNTLTFTRSHNWTTANGGITPIYTSAERDAISPYIGQSIFYVPDLEQQTWDGTDWSPPVGDTGWEDLVLGSNYETPAGQHVAQCRRIGKEVRLRGSIQRKASAGDLGNGHTPATVPSGFRPPALTQTRAIPSNTLNGQFKLTIDTDGTVTFVMNAGGTAPSYFCVDGTTYLID